MLRVSDLRSGYGGTPVILGVSLEVAPGEIVAVLGRNGMGKSTLLKTLAGLLPAREGSIELDGADITKLPAHRRCHQGLGYVPQGRQIFPRLSVQDNLKVGAMAAGGTAECRVQKMLDEFPALVDRLQVKGESLSGGEQQQLALARALAAGPKVLLLDEPSEGIQPSVVISLGEKILDLSRRQGLAVLLVEQNLDFASTLASRAYLMVKGQISREVATSEIADNAEILHEYMGV
jgi:urea ABC transporter ATP-binding protein UrtE